MIKMLYGCSLQTCGLAISGAFNLSLEGFCRMWSTLFYAQWLCFLIYRIRVQIIYYGEKPQDTTKSISDTQ